MKLTLDIGSSKKFFKDLKNATPEIVNAAMSVAGKALLYDTKFETPTIPKDEGILEGKGQSFVEARGRTTEAVIVFDSDYAAYQHRGMRYDGTHVVRNYSEPGSGKHFISAKIMKNKDKYRQIIAAVIGRKQK